MHELSPALPVNNLSWLNNYILLLLFVLLLPKLNSPYITVFNSTYI
jgi:hypothetical protein